MASRLRSHPGPDVRLEEARRAAEILGVHVRVNLNLPNRRLFDDLRRRAWPWPRSFRKHRPKVVDRFRRQDGAWRAPDHFQAMQITDAAVFYSRLTKWDEHFDGLPVHTISNQLGVPDRPASPGICPRRPGTVVTDHRRHPGGQSSTSIACYKTQFPGRRKPECVCESIETMNRYHGLTAGFEAGDSS